MGPTARSASAALAFVALFGCSGGDKNGSSSSGGSAAAGTTGTGATGTGGGSSTGGATNNGGAFPGGGYGNGTPPGTCSGSLSARVEVNEVDVGVTVAYNEIDNNGSRLGLTPLMISPIPSGGSRVAFLGKTDGMVHVATLDGGDKLVAGSVFGLPGYDVQDIYADSGGGVLLVSRTAQGSTANHNCGDINNLCGLNTNYPVDAECYDMYMVRFDGKNETWATKLTETTATLPAYSTDPDNGSNVIFIWSPYAHNGRIAFDGSNFAGYFGAAITVPGQNCVDTNSTRKTGVNIHQGDRMNLVSASGQLQSGGFDWGCSHSGYERVVWDSAAKKFVGVCKNDAPTGGKSGRIAFPPRTTTIYPVDLSYSNLGSVENAGGGGYWIISSDIRTGQPANANGQADVHLLHVASTTNPTPDSDIVLANQQNSRAPHLALYGTGKMLAAWEHSSQAGDLRQSDANRQMVIEILDSTTGKPPSASTTDSAGPLELSPNVLGSRYQDFRAFPNGSVAYVTPGSSPTSLKILRVVGCTD